MTRRMILVLALVPVLALALPVRRLREMIAVAASAISPYRNPELLLEFEDDDFSTSGTVHDTSGNDYHLDVVVGGMGEGTRGSRKTAIFYGTNEVRRAVANWNASDRGTINIWIYPTARGAGYERIFASERESSDTDSISLLWRSRSDLERINFYAGINKQYNAVRSNSGTAPINTWTMVTLVSTGTAWQYYINGAIATTTTLLGSNDGRWWGDVPNRESITVGYQNLNSSPGQFFSGHISDLYITNEVLTDAEILELYNRTK